MTRSRCSRLLATVLPAVFLFTSSALPLLGCDPAADVAPPSGQPLADPTVTDDAALLAGRALTIERTVTRYSAAGTQSWTVAAPVSSPATAAAIELSAQSDETATELAELALVLAAGDFDIDGDSAVSWQVGIDRYHLYRWGASDLWTVQVLDCALDDDVVDCAWDYRGVLSTDFDLIEALEALMDGDVDLDVRVAGDRAAGEDGASCPASATTAWDGMDAIPAWAGTPDDPLVEPDALDAESVLGPLIAVAVIAVAVAVTVAVVTCTADVSASVNTVPGGNGEPVYAVSGSVDVNC